MLRRLYDWTLSLAEHPRALWALALVAFVESSFFPIPPDILMIPMIIARPSRAWLIALVAMVASVVGGLFGYFIGAALFDTLGQAIFDFYGKADAVESFNQRFNEYGAWAVLIAGITPFPYKVITIASGATGLNLMVFMLASVAARGLRFFVVCGLLYWLGPPIRNFIEKRLGLVFTVFVVMLFGGFVALKFLI